MGEHMSGSRSTGPISLSMRRRIFVATVSCLVVFFANSTSAWAASQDGYKFSNGSLMDGTSASLRVDQASPGSGQCLVWSTLGSATGRLIEIGLTTCSNTAIDGTCGRNQLTKFLETYNGSSYTCFPHGNASTVASYSATVRADTGTSSTWHGYFGSGPQLEGQTGFNQAVTAFGWGEETPTTSCSPWSGVGYVQSWQWWNSTSGWHTLTSATAYSGFIHCWTVGSINSAGTFKVSK
jgi:hypothetical protein